MEMVREAGGAAAPMHHRSPGAAARRRARREKNEEVVVIDDDDDPVFKKPDDSDVIVLGSDSDDNDAPAASSNSGGMFGRRSVGSGSGSMRLQGVIPRDVKREDDGEEEGVDGGSSSAERHGGAAHGGAAAQQPARMLVIEEHGASRGEGGSAVSAQHSSGVPAGKRQRSEGDDLADQGSAAACSHTHKEHKRAEHLTSSDEGGCSSWSHSAAGAASSSAAKEARAVDPSPAVNQDGTVQCQRCATEVDATTTVLLSCSHRACIPCLQLQHGAPGDGKAAVGGGALQKTRGKCADCLGPLTEAELKLFLPSEQVVAVMDEMLMDMMSTDNRFVRCPKPGCSNAIEREVALGALPTHAPDGQPLGRHHAAHMQKNRFRCAACTTNFCAECGQFPYHVAKTCSELAVHKAKTPCRFCEVPLPKGRNRARCCAEKECQDRLGNACEITHPSCGHQCLGVFGESSCPPCIECADEHDDFCNICWTEVLKAAPVARLKCGHTFHLHCIQKRLEKKWPTARISFAFADCPLCQRNVDHPSLDGAMRQVRGRPSSYVSVE
ncbi:hypothetical protein T484DRAFT_2779102 [Baffinella frigidus]|nr:hypothetical protein T484DRAFT_2779102 [Cryptophyta sp. CCMP2293]